MVHRTQNEKLRSYFLNKNNSLHQAIVKAVKEYTPLNLGRNVVLVEPLNIAQRKKDTWAGKTLHGKQYKLMQNPDIDTKRQSNTSY